MEFRAFEDADLGAYVAVRNRADPHRLTSESAVRHADSTRASDAAHARLLVYEGSELVGAINLQSPLSSPQPLESQLQISLLPAWLDRAEAVYERALEEARWLGATRLRAGSKEDFWYHNFLVRHGFTELERMWDSDLELGIFDPAQFESVRERSRVAGMRVETLEGRVTDLDFLRRYYDATIEVLRDVPSALPFDPWSFKVWQQRVLEDPDFLPEAHFIGVVNGEIAGVSQLARSSRPDTLQTGLTGVRAQYRRKGIAFSLKLEAARYAKAQGFERVRTNNHVNNRAMLAINEAMGFVKEPAMVFLRKELEG
jgi:GNAT superfamily N-acetyltransferase